VDAGDLHWQRSEAGLYFTQFWANGYRYKIEKDDYFANTWHVYYRWDKWSEAMMYEPLAEGQTRKRYRWVKVMRGYGSSQQTLKHAKRVALSHNLRPRRKFKFVGRVTEEQIGKPRSTGLGRYLGYLKYQEEGRDGKLMEYQTHYMNPKAIGGEDREQINADEERKRTQAAMESLARVTLKIPEDAKL
jgi:hypothetical protein